MMINKRLIGAVEDTKKYVAGNVAVQWVSLMSNAAMMGAVARLLGRLSQGQAAAGDYILTAVIALAAVVIRAVCTVLQQKMAHLSSAAVKKTLRRKIYEKLLRLGAGYRQRLRTSEVVQVAVEGVDQLETYFGAYLPQFFYAMLAPLTLFVVLSFVDLPSALVLLVCVPLIPVAIAAVQTWAKKLLSKYWGQYTELGDTFLENLQGLTTLKIYQTDGLKAEEMAEQSERFRKITMRVLTMQLNSITIMDVIAYGGAALGMIVAVCRFRGGYVDLSGCLLIILLSADYFIPMRLLGSFFHIAMNGMAASDKIFALLDMPEPAQPTGIIGSDCGIQVSDVRFAYEPEREILSGVSMEFAVGSFTAIVGESGCGKSTMASILMGRSTGYAGSVTIGGTELRNIAGDSIFRHITYISHKSHLFRGTVRENLLMGQPDADDGQLWEALEQVNLAAFLRSENGLDTMLTEQGGNLSGGQCQRLALARALLHDSPVYIFDEATSNIDVESENNMMDRIYDLAKTKTVILISHRLANVAGADRIYVMKNGMVTESGDHAALLAADGDYARLWNAQQELEHYGKEDKA